jgi:hypothetical protein
VGDSLDFGGLSDGLIDGEPALAVNEVRGKNGVDQRRLSETGLSCRELSDMAGKWGKGDVPTQMMLNWKPRLSSFLSIWLVIESNPT